MIIGRISSGIEALAAAVNPHKEAMEQQTDELADYFDREKKQKPSAM